MKPIWITLFSGFVALTLMSGPAAASGDVDEGAEFFKKRCKSCHDIEAGKHKMGPSLAGVMGRKAGSTDFPKYTGLAGSEVVWDEESLDKFLADPKEFVGAKTMAYKVKKEEDRANVIEFMKTLK